MDVYKYFFHLPPPNNMKPCHFQLISPRSSLFFFFFLILRCLTVAIGSCHVDDEAGLLGLKLGITADPSGLLDSWKPGSDCCTWLGVSCRVNNRVTELSIYGQPDKPGSFLSGTISPSLSKIRYLVGIYLEDLRNISGPFPDALFSLPDLQFVYIQNSKLSGQIPVNIGNLTRLEALNLAGNRFSGRVPSSMSKLTGLTQLNFRGNLLSGEVPDGIRQLKNLTLLGLDRNQFSGSIPDFFTSFSNLRTLQLSHNKFSGKIPASIATLAPKLAYLELGHNSLTGQIPEFLGNFRALDTLDLSWNRLSGMVPKSFGNLTKIFNLDLSHNFLADSFPPMNVKGIESLDLSYNSFNLGEIPKWVTSSPIIYSLRLADCGIKIKLDDWKPSETYFYDYIDLSENQLSGSPIGLLNRTDYLVEFRASGNGLRFNMEGLRFPKTLKNLDLSKNLVFGKLPQAVSVLETMNVSYNHLCGPIPAAKFPASVFAGNDCLCGSPLPPCKA